MHITLFGPFGIAAPNGTDLTPTGKKAKALIALLALAPGGKRTRAWVQDRLWSDKPGKQGRASLRQLLSDLRRHFVATGYEIIEHGRDDIVLNLAQVRIDLHHETPPAHYELFEGLDVGDPEFEDWLSDERAHWYAKLSEQTIVTNQPVQAVPDIKPIDRRLVPRIALRDFAPIGTSDAVQSLAAGVASEITAMFAHLPDTYHLIYPPPPDSVPTEYALTGSVREGAGFRITAQLSRHEDGIIMWTQKYDLPSALEFDAQELVARSIVEALQKVLNDGSVAGEQTNSDVPTGAWELFQKARSLESLCGRVRFNPSIGYFREAIELHPTFVAARIGLAFRYIDGIRNCWVDDPDEAIANAKLQCAEIKRISQDNPWVQALDAFVACAERDFETGLAIMSAVTADAPDSPEFTGCLGAVLDYCGDLDRAERMHLHALSLKEYPPAWVHTNLAFTYLIMQDPRALGIADQILATDPKNPRALTAKAISHLRRGEEAAAKDAAEALRVQDPRLTADTWRSPLFYKVAEHHAAIAGDLAKLGF